MAWGNGLLSEKRLVGCPLTLVTCTLTNFFRAPTVVGWAITGFAWGLMDVGLAGLGNG